MALLSLSLLPAPTDAAPRDRRGDTGSLDAGGAGFPGTRMMEAMQERKASKGRDGAQLPAAMAGRADGSGSQAAMLNMRATHMRWSAASVRGALHAPQIHQALHATQALNDPRTRAMVTSALATVAWHRGGHGWWRHNTGGYGWVGPVFWPFAFYDISNAALWGDSSDPTFWSYGTSDLHAGLFGPYAYDDLTGYATHLRAARHVSGAEEAASAAGIDKDDQNSLAQLCGDTSRSIAGLPVDIIAQAISPTEAQRAALDTLADASAKASQILQAACPTDMVLTAPRRLAIMQTRITAMISAVQTLQPALEAFYGPLSEEQKLQFDAIATAQRTAADKAMAEAAQATDSRNRRHRSPRREMPIDPAATVQNCSDEQPDGVTAWPAAMVTQSVVPTDAQRGKIEALQRATTQAAEMLKASCTPAAATTPPARLAAIGRRLEAMLRAVTTVHAALDDAYATMNDEQKVSFDTVGAQQMVAIAQPTTDRRGRRSRQMPSDTAQATQPPAAQAASESAEPKAAETRPAARRYVRYARHHGRHGVRVTRVLRRMLFSFVR
ncbi:Spy/CpxP family protein refolding chaperone [Bradyrhizobium prioriisuperbiae]|uniref:Spy/CpxP family protein refolding chaperone n=1 Tax=Bradyrhizobium prioriisuperbiae TaxID=2854389 RepID=UPI0028EADAE8|nr:Spy/CpxP family protein refolding chaperone [Bradyrhizobium prioritasuperba]